MDTASNNHIHHSGHSITKDIFWTTFVSFLLPCSHNCIGMFSSGKRWKRSLVLENNLEPNKKLNLKGFLLRVQKVQHPTFMYDIFSHFMCLLFLCLFYSHNGTIVILKLLFNLYQDRFLPLCCKYYSFCFPYQVVPRQV